jgi:hypothetical protein
MFSFLLIPFYTTFRKSIYNRYTWGNIYIATRNEFQFTGIPYFVSRTLTPYSLCFKHKVPNLIWVQWEQKGDSEDAASELFTFAHSMQCRKLSYFPRGIMWNETFKISALVWRGFSLHRASNWHHITSTVARQITNSKRYRKRSFFVPGSRHCSGLNVTYQYRGNHKIPRKIYTMSLQRFEPRTRPPTLKTNLDCYHNINLRRFLVACSELQTVFRRSQEQV